MDKKLETRKYTFTVEGETEQWYFEWLRDQINLCPNRTYNVSVDAKVQQSPRKFYKSINAKTTPQVIHICDVESNDRVHVDKFNKILSEMKEAKSQKRITYILGYSKKLLNLRNSIAHGISTNYDYLSLAFVGIMVQMIWDISTNDVILGYEFE